MQPIGTLARDVRSRLAASSLIALAIVLGCGDDDAPTGAADGATPTPPPPTPGSDAGVPAPAPVPAPPSTPFGDEHEGEYHLGPVEWEGSFWNACAPYPAPIQGIEGAMLAGLSNEIAADGSHCDACIRVTTALGHSVVARVVTYGVTQAPGNIDVSQAAFDLLTEGEFPRTMRWQLVPCDNGGPLFFQFQTGANPWWTSLWVRNPRIAIDRVEVRSANHAEAFALRLSPDGTFTDDGGFGEGPFTLRVVGLDGSSFEQTFDGFEAGALVEASGNL